MQPNDLVGYVFNKRTPKLAIIADVRPGKVLIINSISAKTSKWYSFRDIFLIGSSRNFSPDLLSDALAAIPLLPSIFSTAWIESQRLIDLNLLDGGIDLISFAKLLFANPSPTDLAACWLSLANKQDLFRVRQDTIFVRSQPELQQLRQARRRQQLAIQIKSKSEVFEAEHFPAECLAEADRLVLIASECQPGDSARIDLSHLRSFSIDDPCTVEIDDAISIEHSADGIHKIWIHVADPHRLIQPGGCLDLEAQRRASSIYLSHRLVPMFPIGLGSGPLSLSPGSKKAAISVAICLDQNSCIVGIDIVRSWVQITYALSYSDADELIELAPPQDADLAEINALLLNRRLWRQAQGALLMDQPEGRFIRMDGRPQLEITEPGCSRAMVAEAMLLAGAAVANWAKEHQLAMPFRCQAGNQSLAPDQLIELPAGAVRWAHQRLGLGRSRLQSEAAAHQALGLSAYLQWTSPIRRYNDLLAHRQWLTHQNLIEAEPLAKELINPLLEKLEQQSREVGQISKEDQRCCLLEWLESLKPKLIAQDGVMLRWLREDQNLALVRIEPWALELPARLRDPAGPGDLLKIHVQEVDPARDLLHLKATIG